MKKICIGFALTGSFCTFERALKQMEELVRRGYDVLPVLSFNAAQLDTRFMKASEVKERIRHITGTEAVDSLAAAEPIGPKKLLDALIIAPCTGNTLAKLAHSIADTSVTMAAKSHLRNGRPVIIAVSTNDALGAAAENIGRLLSRKHFYFVPFRQDDAQNKPTSMVADFTRIPDTLEAAINATQLQPVIL